MKGKKMTASVSKNETPADVRITHDSKCLPFTDEKN